MSQLSAEQMARMKSSAPQTIEKQAYAKFKALLYSPDKTISREVLLMVVQCYYDNAIGERAWSTIERDIHSLRTEDLQESALKLCSEAINRDMIAYVMQGKRGDHAAKMFKLLKNPQSK
ncbi:MAG: hypothetical protein H0X02_12690 [Nitrosomonas sp.]|nr:hypothetical protein [Nitrosomonas sp.]